MRVSCLCLLTVVLLSACSTTTSVRPTAQQLKLDSYSTQYLGDNNRVVTRLTKAAKTQGGGYWKGGVSPEHRGERGLLGLRDGEQQHPDGGGERDHCWDGGV